MFSIQLILAYNNLALLNERSHRNESKCLYNYTRERPNQPVAEVLAYLHVQISPISCCVELGRSSLAWIKTLTQQL